MADEIILNENFVLNGQMVGNDHTACNGVMNELRDRLKKSNAAVADLNLSLDAGRRIVRGAQDVERQRDALLKQVDGLTEKLCKRDILEAACAGFRNVLSKYVKLQAENKCDKPDCAICVQHRKESIEAAVKALEVPVGHQMLNVFKAAQDFVESTNMSHQNNDGDDVCLSCDGPHRDGQLSHYSECTFQQLKNAVYGKDSAEVKEEIPF
jgi:hypothetical protein